MPVGPAITNAADRRSMRSKMRAGSAWRATHEASARCPPGSTVLAIAAIAPPLNQPASKFAIDIGRGIGSGTQSKARRRCDVDSLIPECPHRTRLGLLHPPNRTLDAALSNDLSRPPSQMSREQNGRRMRLRRMAGSPQISPAQIVAKVPIPGSSDRHTDDIELLEKAVNAAVDGTSMNS